MDPHAPTLLRCSTGTFLVAQDGPPDAPPLLFSNSLSSDLTMWQAQAAALAGRFRVICYNGRGQPGSESSAGSYTIEQLGRDVLAILDALEVETVRFCGLSMGGMVGLWLATHVPERIERAVLANTAAHMGPASLWDGRIALARQHGMEATVEPTVTRWFREDVHRAQPAMMQRMRAMIRGTPLDGYIACCEAIRDMDQRSSIAAITRPVLVVVGEHDVATTPADGQLIQQRIAGSELLTLPTGHISAVEQPQMFTQALLDFLG